MDNSHLCNEFLHYLCQVVPTLDENESAVSALIHSALSANFLAASSETLVAFCRKADYKCCLGASPEAYAAYIAKLESAYHVKLQSMFLLATVADPKIHLVDLEEAVCSIMQSLSDDTEIAWAIQDESEGSKEYKPYEASIRFAALLFFTKTAHPGKSI